MNCNQFMVLRAQRLSRLYGYTWDLENIGGCSGET